MSKLFPPISQAGFLQCAKAFRLDLRKCSKQRITFISSYFQVWKPNCTTCKGLVVNKILPTEFKEHYETQASDPGQGRLLGNTHFRGRKPLTDLWSRINSELLLRLGDEGRFDRNHRCAPRSIRWVSCFPKFRQSEFGSTTNSRRPQDLFFLLGVHRQCLQIRLQARPRIC